MTSTQEALRSGLGQRVAFRERRPGISQVIAPIFHEDGDMIDIFLDTNQPPSVTRVTDAGLTLMKLSYNFDIDTPNKERLLQRIIRESGVEFDNGEIFIDGTASELPVNFLHLSQVIARVSSLQYLKRQVVATLFYEQLAKFIETELTSFKPRQQVAPLPDRPELEADWVFTLPTKPVYLFGVKDASKARLSAISCLEFQRRNLSFRSIVVHEDYEGLPKKDQRILMNAADKQFASLPDFTKDAEQFLGRELAA